MSGRLNNQESATPFLCRAFERSPRLKMSPMTNHSNDQMAHDDVIKETDPPEHTHTPSNTHPHTHTHTHTQCLDSSVHLHPLTLGCDPISQSVRRSGAALQARQKKTLKDTETWKKWNKETFKLFYGRDGRVSEVFRDGGGGGGTLNTPVKHNNIYNCLCSL